MLRRFAASSKPTRGDALDLGRGVDLGVDRPLAAAGQVLDAARLAEIDAAGELAQDHDVQPLDQLALERGGVGERREDHCRAQVGEQVELLAERQEATLGLGGEGQRIPFRPADGAEHDGADGLGLLQRRRCQRHAMHVVGGAADQILLDRERDLPPCQPADDAPDLDHDLGADTVAGEEQDRAEFGHGRLRALTLDRRRPALSPAARRTQTALPPGMNYSGTVSPVPPNASGKSLSLGRPSFIGSTVSA